MTLLKGMRSALLVAALAAPTYGAKQQQQLTSGPSAGGAPSQRQQSQTPPKYRVNGQITHMKEVTIGGRRHVLARLRTPNGRFLVLDVGDTNLPRLDVRRGEPITAFGGAGRINGEPVLVVDRLIADAGRTLTIVRGPQADRFRQLAQGRRPSAASSPRQPQYMTDVRGTTSGRVQRSPARASDSQAQPITFLTGRVIQARETQTTGDRQPHVLALVRTRDGRTVIADLGTRQRLGDISLHRGELVGIIGTRGIVNGRSCLVANAVADVNVVRGFHGISTADDAARGSPSSTPSASGRSGQRIGTGGGQRL